VTGAATLQAGEIVAGKFCVERIIATGGVGVVVAARHLQLGETVALKFLLPQVDREATDIARFVREAQSAAKLNEHVARVLDVGSLEDGSPFMVMEYLDGEDLDHLLRHRGPLSIPDAVGHIMQACEAIAEAHHIGIVHRDLKPSNFFLTTRTDGSPLIKVLDFGIAKARAELEQDVSLTKTRTVLGSPVYMSPEQIRSARSVDHRSDIWSLGVTLYELLTDQLPFDGDSITGVAAAVSTDPIAPIRSIRPEIPIGLSLVVERCLQKKTTDRYQTIAEFAEDLEPYGPESARYSLTRIRGALGMKTSESGKHTRPGLADTSEGLSPTATLMSTNSSTVYTPEQRTRRRRLVLVASVFLILASMGTLVLSHRKTAATQVAEPTALTAATVSPSDPAVTAVPEPDKPTTSGLINMELERQATLAPSTVSIGSISQRKPIVAGVPATHSPDSKSLISKRLATPGPSTNRREQDIFDTRR
jgi:serine/threonine-protein kinase